MSEILLVLQREFRERVQTRSFLLGTILFPLFVAGVMILPGLFGGGEARAIVVVDEAPGGIAQGFAELLGTPPENPEANSYTVQVLPGPLDAVRESLNSRVRAEEIDGYVIVPADVLESNEIRYRSTTIAGPGVLRDLRLAASRAVQAERLRDAGLDVQAVAALIRNVAVDNARITAAGEDAGDARSTFLVAYIIAFAIYFLTAIYGAAVLRSVLEEKTNRIAEVLVSSMRASHLMAGKVLGVGSAALLQVVIWAVSIVLLVSNSERLASRFQIPPEAVRAIGIEPLTAVLLFGFFMFGFFLFAALFAALGAAVNSEQEAQSFQMFLMVPLFLPLLFMMPLTTEPLGRVSTVLGLVPFTAPIAMPMRMAAAPIPPAQIAASLALLLLALAAVSWMAGKIYRIGILSTGKRPSLKELGRWLRTA